MGEITETQMTILEVLARVGQRTRDVLSIYTSIPRTTLYENLIKLQRMGYVRHYGLKVDRHQVGRNKIVWQIAI